MRLVASTATTLGADGLLMFVFAICRIPITLQLISSICSTKSQRKELYQKSTFAFATAISFAPVPLDPANAPKAQQRSLLP